MMIHPMIHWSTSLANSMTGNKVEFFNSIGTFESRVRGLKLTDTVEKLYDKNIIVRRSLSIYFFNAELGDIQKMKVFLAQKTINI